MFGKFLSGVAAIALAAGFFVAVSDMEIGSNMTANALTDDDGNEYTEGTYESLTYQKYSDHIVISDCYYLTLTVNIPDEIDGLSVTEIDDWAFSSSFLTSISIPDSVVTIGDYAFCFSRVTEITIPKSVKEIGAHSFSNCKFLTKIIIPNSITSIPNNAFEGCTNLTDVIIPNSVTEINKWAFENCTSLTKITIPESVEEIGYEAFIYCMSMNEITILNPNCKIYDSPQTILNGFDEKGYRRYDGVIRGYENSTAQAYAEKYGYKFEIIDESSFVLGDVDGDGIVDSSDATLVLTEYSLVQTGGGSSFTPEQFKAADVNKDGTVDSSDASKILAYYADISTGKNPSWD